MDLGLTLRFYFFVLFFVAFPSIFLYEETTKPGGIVNLWVRKNIYNQGNLWDFLAEDPYKVDYDHEVPECDH